MYPEILNSRVSFVPWSTYSNIRKCITTVKCLGKTTLSSVRVFSGSVAPRTAVPGTVCTAVSGPLTSTATGHPVSSHSRTRPIWVRFRFLFFFSLSVLFVLSYFLCLTLAEQRQLRLSHRSNVQYLK